MNVVVLTGTGPEQNVSACEQVDVLCSQAWQLHNIDKPRAIALCREAMQMAQSAKASLLVAIHRFYLCRRGKYSDFVQVNGEMNRRMVSHVLDLLQLDAGSRVLDLFCGLGNFTLPLARRASEVVGIEGEEGLVQRARDNAASNGLSNVRFHAAKLGWYSFLSDKRNFHKSMKLQINYMIRLQCNYHP